jgi:hypothetical protein
VDQAKVQTSATQFLMWQKRLEDEPNEFNPTFWYLAQIAEQVYLLRNTVANMMARTPVKPTGQLKDFILKFGIEVEKKPSIEELEEKTRASKSSWFAVLGLDASGKVKGKLQTRTPPPIDHSKRTFQFGRKQRNGN